MQFQVVSKQIETDEEMEAVPGALNCLSEVARINLRNQQGVDVILVRDSLQTQSLPEVPVSDLGAYVSYRVGLRYLLPQPELSEEDHAIFHTLSSREWESQGSAVPSEQARRLSLYADYLESSASSPHAASVEAWTGTPDEAAAWFEQSIGVEIGQWVDLGLTPEFEGRLEKHAAEQSLLVGAPSLDPSSSDLRSRLRY